MKRKSIFLGLFMCCFALISAFSLTGCGKVNLGTLEESFNQLGEAYAQYSQVFTEGTCEGLQTDVFVPYSSVIDGHISSDADFEELTSLYNFTLAAANQYVKSNQTFILNLQEAELSKSAQKFIATLNQSLVDYTNYLPSFVRERQSFLNHFETFNGLDVNADKAALLRYKKVYGTLVEKAVNLCSNVATMVEESKIFDVIQNTTPTRVDAETIKNYFGARLLPVFSQFRITEFSNKMNWSVQEEGTAKADINLLIANVNQKFATYKNIFITKTTAITLTQQQIKDLFKLHDQFCVEKENYFTALKSFNFASLALNYKNDLNKYLGANIYAKTYLQKMQQFVDVTLANFMSAVESVLYSAGV